MLKKSKMIVSLVKLVYLMVIDPSDGSVEIEFEETVEALRRF